MRIAADYESHLIGPGPRVIPPPICLSVATEHGVSLVGNGDPSWHESLHWVLDQALLHGHELVFHNVGFDLGVYAVHVPGAMDKLWRILERGLVRDTMLREMLLNLALHGYVDTIFLPDGTAKKVSYRLDVLTLKHLGIDHSEQKSKEKGKKKTKDGGEEEDNEDVWQRHFDMLEGKRASEYPDDASKYAKRDSLYTFLIAKKQDEIAAQAVRDGALPATDPEGKPFDVFGTEWLHNAAHFALSLMSPFGFGVDREEVERMKKAVDWALRPEQTSLLYEHKMLDPPKVPRPYSNGALNPDGTPKMTKGRATSKKNLSTILDVVIEVHERVSRCDEDGCPQYGGECEEHGLPPLKHTLPSKRFPKTEDNPEGGQISMDGDVIAQLASFDARIAQYEHYKDLGKLKDQEIPVLQGTDVIRGTYNILVKTGRVSCRKSSFYPSRNLQQVPRGFDVVDLDPEGKPILDANGRPVSVRIEPRRCYKAPTPGWVLISVDYSTLELCTLAQTVYREIGYSRLRDVINSGADPHTWLAGQIAYGSDQDFIGLSLAWGAQDHDARFRVFERLKGGNKEQLSYFKQYRGLGKSGGLGLAGGLGPKKLIEYARKTFGVTIKSLEEAKNIKNIWLESFPEQREYQNRFIRERLRDERHSGLDSHGKKKERYAYFTPFGMYRSNTYWTESCNGYALQSPSAIGGKLAVFNVSRACFDKSMNSVLYGVHPLVYVHDEIMLEAPNDDLLHERAQEVSRIMVQCMKVICPDVTIKAEPSLMERWEKGAEPVYDDRERLQIWRPGVKYRVDEKGRYRT